MRLLIHPAGLLLAGWFALACGDRVSPQAEAQAESQAESQAETQAVALAVGTRATANTDSAEAALRQYQAALPVHPSAFDGGFTSPDAVARALIAALAASDTAALLDLAVSRAEHAYLVYPESPLVRAPYLQPVDVAWSLHAIPHAKGLTRLLQRLGGRPLTFQGIRCRPDQVAEGRNRYWTGCQIRFTVDGEPVEARLFTAIVSRDSRLNVASYDNDF